MPTYEYECPKCGEEFERRLSIEDETPQICDKCGEVAKKIISMPSFILKGDDWPSKVNRIGGQMREKNRRLASRQDEKKRDAPVAKLIPNVEGERTETWKDAQKLAAEKGKDASTYEPMITQEQKVK